MKAAKSFFSLLGLLLMCALLSGGGSARQFSARAATATPASSDWTKKPVERKKSGIAPVTLREVRAADQSDFDRVVFEFKGNVVPGYRVEYATSPIMDEAGRVVKLAGKASLRVDLNPAWAHSNETGAPSVKEREKRLNLKKLIEFKQVEDFEGVVTYALGLRKRAPFRVTEMSNPARLVIDIKH
jgi:hypothetical protein